MTAALSSADLATLQALAASPAAQAMIENRESQRTQERAAILAKLHEAEAAGLAEDAELAKVAHVRLQEVGRLRAELAAAQEAWAEVDTQRSNIGVRLDGLRNHAGMALRPLGDNAIDAATRSVGLALRCATGGASWREVKDPYGAVVDVVPSDPQALTKIAQLQALLKEVQDMRGASVPPRDIESRCKAVEAWVDEGMPPRPSVDARVQGLGLFERIWKSRASAMERRTEH